MVLPGVHLPFRPAHAGAVVADDDEQVLGDESQGPVFPDQFEVREPLPIRADLVLALHDEHPEIAQHAVRLPPSVHIEFDHRLVVLAASAGPGVVVPVVGLERDLPRVRRSSGGMHVGRIEHHAVHGPVRVRQVPAVHALREVAGEHPVAVGSDPPPEDALPVGDIGDHAPRSDIEAEHPGEDLVVRGRIGAPDQVGRRRPAADDAPPRSRTGGSGRTGRCGRRRLLDPRLHDPEGS